MKIIQFTASEVEYNEAIDGEIVQISFDEDPNKDPFNGNKCNVSISQNYEFPGKPTIEWHDGENDDGGAEIKHYELTDNILKVQTNAGISFKVHHHCSSKVLKLIKSFLQREFE